MSPNIYLLNSSFFPHEAKVLIREFALKSLVTKWLLIDIMTIFGNLVTITFQAGLVVADLSCQEIANILASLIEMALNWKSEDLGKAKTFLATYKLSVCSPVINYPTGSQQCIFIPTRGEN